MGGRLKRAAPMTSIVGMYFFSRACNLVGRLQLFSRAVQLGLQPVQCLVVPNEFRAALVQRVQLDRRVLHVAPQAVGGAEQLPELGLVEVGAVDRLGVGGSDSSSSPTAAGTCLLAKSTARGHMNAISGKV